MKTLDSLSSRTYRNPVLRSLRKASGLGGLKKTMPHLKPKVPKFASGGAITDLYAAARPNLYNPDPMTRRTLAAGRQMQGQFVNPDFFRLPGSTMGFQEGGEVDEQMMPEEAMAMPEEAMASEDMPVPEEQAPEAMPEGEGSPQEEQQKQIVVEAMLALEGRHPNPEEALARFVEAFGQGALQELQAMMQGGEPEAAPEPEPQGGMDVSLEAAGGGLLRGPGSGQSDEIEGTTPSGRSVLLSDGEYVIDAPTVAALGDGSTAAGARRLDEMRKSIRKQAWGHDKQAKPMRSGGVVIKLG